LVRAYVKPCFWGMLFWHTFERMNIDFQKYQGTGNDFIIIDNRSRLFPSENTALVAQLCDRKMGIGADGVMLLENDDETDFKMVYYNSDGNLSSMCGNGGRCIVHFANQNQVIGTKTSFTAVDGIHHASVHGNAVNLSMRAVSEVELTSEYAYMNTGSPHYSVWRDDVDQLDIDVEARKIRYNERFAEEGTNVNFLNWSEGCVHMRTYERGVEGETHSCGTGMVAAALYASLANKLNGRDSCKIYTKGGNVEVKFHRNGERTFKEIHLVGPATFVFNGSIDV